MKRGRKRKTLITNELRFKVFLRDNFRCRYCGRDIRDHEPQVAHRIPATKWAIRRYGLEIIDHEINLLTTCSLKCNNAVQMTNRPVDRDHLAKKIRGALEVS